MIFHTFGNPEKKAIILIHGTLTPWQSLKTIYKHFSKNYHVIVPALDGHTGEEASEFISIEQQAQKIEKYIKEKHGGEVFAVCGYSMGGAIASIIWRNGIIKIHNLIMDSAPIMPMGSLPAKVMTNNYLSIIHNSQKRDKKTLDNFKKHFLPEKYLEPFLEIADKMSDSTIRNMISSVCKCELCKGIPHGETKIMYMHGTKGSEFFQMKCGAHLKKHYPEAKVICFRKKGHCEAAIYYPATWIEVAEKFFADKKTDD